MLYITLAFLTGGLVILSMVLNSGLAKHIGVLQGTFVNNIVGLTFTLILFKLNTIDFSLNILPEIPFWAYTGGAIGVLVVGISNVIIPKIPTFYVTLLIFTGQLLTGATVDYVMGRTVSSWKLVGGMLIIIGLIFNSHLDKKRSITAKATL